jgi:hypothetical protein
VQANDAAEAQRLVQVGETLRRRALAFPALSLTGFAPPLRELSLRADGTKATLSSALPERTLATALELLPALSALRHALQLAPAVQVDDAGVAPASSDSDDDNPVP